MTELQLPTGHQLEGLASAALRHQACGEPRDCHTSCHQLGSLQVAAWG